MPEEESIHSVNALLDSLDGERKQYINRYLQDAPHWLLESMQLVKKDKNVVVIEENQNVDTVYILINGVIRAIDYRFFGIEYDYMWFYAVNVFGAMEVLLDIKKYKTTLMSVTPCTLLTIPKDKYEKWMQMDIHALHMETESMGRYLLEQARKERVFLFLQGADRVAYLFTQIYEQTNENNKCVLSLTRKELSERSGLSIKTINRAIKKMEENGTINRNGNKIIIHQKQYLGIKKYLKIITDDA